MEKPFRAKMTNSAASGMMTGFPPCAGVILLSVLSIAAKAEIYKYQDEKGRWHFSDNPRGSSSSEKVEVKVSKTKKAAKPRVFIKSDGTAFRFNAVNPYPIPVQMEVTSQSIGESPLLTLIPPNKTILLYTVENATEKPRFKYRYVIGQPIDRYDNIGYHPPVSQGQKFKISQAFGGKFSHTAKSSFYAVDIAMPVGTSIRAARSGIVVTVKDDYHMGGTIDKKFFLDKANAITVLHDDGTFATYVHLLLGSAMVKPGDTVEAGQVLARSGSSGYSSGPHLHFVVRKNSSMELESLKFFFRDKEGQSIYPVKGELVEGY